MIPRQLCSIPGCGIPALSLSDPPYCRAHIGSLEDWYEHFSGAIDSIDASESDREMERFLAKKEFSSLVYRDSVAAELYRDWSERVEPSGSRKFSIAEIASFCLLAAASGVVGNAAYDAIKALLRRLNPKNELMLERMVSPEKYEEIRRRLHSGDSARIEVSEDIEILVRRRYRILVEREERAGPRKGKRRRNAT